MKVKNEHIMKALEWRYATKVFDSTKKISSEDWNTLSESLRLAPSSYGLQPWKFWIVQNSDLRKKLKDVSWNQSQVTDCSHFVVFTTKKKMLEADIEKFIETTAKTRGLSTDALKGYRDMMLGDIVKGPRSQIVETWAQRQAYIAMGFLMETAALLEIDACPMEGLDPKAYDKLLGLEGSEWATVAAVALGYRHGDDKYQALKKVRYPASEVLQTI